MWSVIGIETLGGLDTFLGILVSSLILGEWVWAKIIRPACVRRRWLKAPKRRSYDG
jgi:hypothetical protein